MEKELLDYVNEELEVMAAMEMSETAMELIESLLSSKQEEFMDKVEEMVQVKLNEIAVKENGNN